jgi:hypothetical protein
MGRLPLLLTGLPREEFVPVLMIAFFLNIGMYSTGNIKHYPNEPFIFTPTVFVQWYYRNRRLTTNLTNQHGQEENLPRTTPTNTNGLGF